MRKALSVAAPVTLLGIALCLCMCGTEEPLPPALEDDAMGKSGSPDDTWPMFHRTPHLDGCSDTRFSDGLKLSWRFETGGPVASSAVIANGRVFVGSDDGGLYALDLESGDKLWRFVTGGAVESSPLLLGGTLFVGSSDCNLYAVDARTGKLKWKRVTGGKIVGGVNRIFFGDMNAGHEENEARIVVGSYDNKLYCFGAKSGDELWTYESESYINGMPAVAKGMVVFGGCDALVHFVSGSDGSCAARIDAGSYIAASPLFDGEHVYVGQYDGRFLCVDAALKKILWSYEGDGTFFSTACLGREFVVFGCRDRRVHCVRRDTGKGVWTFQTQGAVDSSPVLVGDKVLVGSDDGRFYMLSLDDGKELWCYEIGEPVIASPAVAERRVVVGATDGAVYAFEDRL